MHKVASWHSKCRFQPAPGAILALSRVHPRDAWNTTPCDGQFTRHTLTPHRISKRKPHASQIVKSPEVRPTIIRCAPTGMRQMNEQAALIWHYPCKYSKNAIYVSPARVPLIKENKELLLYNKNSYNRLVVK